MSSPSLKMIARKPSHFGSCSHPSPSGIFADSFDNIGATGGLNGRIGIETRNTETARGVRERSWMNVAAVAAVAAVVAAAVGGGGPGIDAAPNAGGTRGRAPT